MYEIERTEEFSRWLAGIRDPMTQVRIASRLERMAEGLFGDWKAVSGPVCEVRLHFGAGYRIYFRRSGNAIIILLCGGDKSTQSADIIRALELARGL